MNSASRLISRSARSPVSIASEATARQTKKQPAQSKGNESSREDDAASYTNNTSTDGCANAGPRIDTVTFFSVYNPTPLTSLSILSAPIHANGNAEVLANIKATNKTLIIKAANIGRHSSLFPI